MSITNSFNFHDGSNLPDQLIDFFSAYLLTEGINQLRKRFINKRNFNFRKTLGWVRIGLHLISFVTMATFDAYFEKIHLKPIAKLCGRILLYNIKQGIDIFIETEPELSKKLATTLEQVYDDYQIYKTTGIKTSLLQRYLPNLT